MTQSLLQRALQLGCAATIAALSAAAQAQYGSPAAPAVPRSAPSVSTPAPQAPGPKAQADANYEAALSACDQKPGTARTDCIRNAKTDYDLAIAQLSGSNLPSQTAPNGGGPNGAGHSGSMSGAVRQSR